MSSRKPSLVLVHGYRGAPIGLKTIAEQLEEAGYEVYVPAIPPFGGATLGHTYDAKSYANYLAKYIKSKSLDHPVLIGHSMGSIIVAATAHFHPDLINQKIIFLSPIPERTGKVFQIISPLASFLPSRMVDYATTRFLFVSPQKSIFHNALSLTHECTASSHPTKKDLIAATNFSTHSSISDFPLQKSVCIIAGAQDRLVSSSSTRTLAERLQAELHFIPDSGHLHNYEAPAETTHLILDYIK